MTWTIGVGSSSLDKNALQELSGMNERKNSWFERPARVRENFCCTIDNNQQTTLQELKWFQNLRMTRNSRNLDKQNQSIETCCRLKTWTKGQKSRRLRAFGFAWRILLLSVFVLWLFANISASSLGVFKATTSCIAASCPEPIYSLHTGSVRNMFENSTSQNGLSISGRQAGLGAVWIEVEVETI